MSAAPPKRATAEAEFDRELQKDNPGTLVLSPGAAAPEQRPQAVAEYEVRGESNANATVREFVTRWRRKDVLYAKHGARTAADNAEYKDLCEQELVLRHQCVSLPAGIAVTRAHAGRAPGWGGRIT